MAETGGSPKRSRDPNRCFAGSTVLLVGVGGIGSPALLGLVRAGVGRVIVADDDRVELSNLHRQILFNDDDVGRPKVDTAIARLKPELAEWQCVESAGGLLLPESAPSMLEGVDVIVEGADNFATKFLTSDVGQLAQLPRVHAAAIRWQGTAWAVSPNGKPCYRCLFEDVPPPEANLVCSEAGVMGPVVGLVGALAAELALKVLAGDSSVFGQIMTYDGKRDRLRSVAVPSNPKCPSCGECPQIFDLSESRYTDGLAQAPIAEQGESSWM